MICSLSCWSASHIINSPPLCKIDQLKRDSYSTQLAVCVTLPHAHFCFEVVCGYIQLIKNLNYFVRGATPRVGKNVQLHECFMLTSQDSMVACYALIVQLELQSSSVECKRYQSSAQHCKLLVCLVSIQL